MKRLLLIVFLMPITLTLNSGCDDWDDTSDEPQCCSNGAAWIPTGDGGLSIQQEQNVTLFPPNP